MAFGQDLSQKKEKKIKELYWNKAEIKTRDGRPLTNSLTYDASHQTQNDRDGHEGPVPVVLAPHRRYAQKDKDERLADAAPHFQEVLDGGVGLVGYVGLHVGAHHSATRYQPGKDRRKRAKRQLV